MSKYDFEIDLTDRTSTGIILNKIPRGSVVLEFGCATGRMTRYMKEELDCRVYIVEFDQRAYEKAKQYAQDGICDDIMNYRWMESFGQVRFDVIIFADVLEHLTKPDQVLMQAAKLLKDDGSIHISVPNITHNDIVLKAYDEHFDYTKTGLLDEDHVHFWGMENLKDFARQCGLSIRSIRGTYCTTGMTEQGGSAENKKLLTNILRERQCGEVYQFLVTMDKGEASQPQCDLVPPPVKSHIYLDTGAGFNAEQFVVVEAAHTEVGSYLAEYRVEDVQNLKNIRFDPVEMQGCILAECSIAQGEELLPLNGSKMVKLPFGIYLPGDDPMIWAEVPQRDVPVVVRAEFFLPGEGYLARMEESVTRQNDTLRRMGLEGENAQERIDRWLDLWNQTVVLTRELEKSRLEIELAEKENQQTRDELCGYIILSDWKERLLIETEQQLKETGRQLEETCQRLEETRWALSELERKTRIFMKCRRFAGRILRGIKWRVKRLLGKGNTK